MAYKVQPFHNIDGPVGSGRANLKPDVYLVQYLLTKVASKTVGKWTPPATPLKVDGEYSPNLTAWILSYQKVVAGHQDGVVDPQKQPHWVHYGTIVSLNASYRNNYGAKRHDNIAAESDCPPVLRSLLGPGNAKPEMGTTA
jgi:hypothetical protein